MKILHFILGKANPDRANGVNQVIYGLAKYQSLSGHEVHVLGISKSMSNEKEIIDRKFFKVEAHKKFGNNEFKRLKDIAVAMDIVHLHGVWNHYNIQVGKYLTSISKPYVITAHCGYSIDRMRQSNYRIKMLYHKLWQKKLYEQARGIHAITREESADILHFCNCKNIFVIPNGVDFETYKLYQYQCKNRSVIKLGYLGRLSTEKNIDNLIRTIAILPKNIRDKVELNLIGPIKTPIKRLQQLAVNLDISDNVKFVGEKFGADKIQALLDLDVYIHPAYSDVIGISVMEALALGIPSIITRTSQISYYYNSEIFEMVEPTTNDMCRGICEIIAKKNEWKSMSEKSKELAFSIFNWEKVTEKMINEYQRII